MDHDGLRPPALQIKAHGHRDGHVLMRNRHRLGRLGPVRAGLGVGLDQRREIAASVGEQVVDAAIGEDRQIGVGHRSIDDLGRRRPARFGPVGDRGFINFDVHMGP